jgi:hypothetical protein
MKYQCPNCKSPVIEGDKTCQKCGEKLFWEKYRVLSIIALVIGILATVTERLLFRTIPITLPGDVDIIFIYITPVLSIVAVVCGSIDLKRIQSGCYSSKGGGFDVAGITLGGFLLLMILPFLLAGLLFPH